MDGVEKVVPVSVPLDALVPSPAPGILLTRNSRHFFVDHLGPSLHIHDSQSRRDFFFRAARPTQRVQLEKVRAPITVRDMAIELSNSISQHIPVQLRPLRADSCTVGLLHTWLNKDCSLWSPSGHRTPSRPTLSGPGGRGSWTGL